ncbi:MAG: ABC transporter permease [Novosphingobium sp.]
MTILATSLIVFLATQALPSDPARVILGPEASEASLAILRGQLGLDQPLPQQYAAWINGVLQGDFGRSLDSSVAVKDILAQRVDASLALLFWVLALAVPLSLVTGIWLARRADRLADRMGLTLLILVKALPAFVIGILLVMIFATGSLRLLPAVSLLNPNATAFFQFEYLVLPVATLVLSIMPYLVRLVRSAMIEALAADHVTAARLRGIPERRLVWRHAFPGAVVPTIQGVALMTRVLLGGVIVVEVVFAYPGLGTAINSAIEMRDVPVIQAIAVLIAAGVVIVNLIADTLTVLLTPRLRTADRPAIQPGTRARLRQEAGI